MAVAEQPAQAGEYKQQLARDIGLWDAIAITISGISPIASVFIIAPVVFDQQGSGVFLSAVIALVICIGMALCYSELASAFPVSGADYAIISRVLGKPLGFLAFVDFMVLALVGPSTIGLGVAPYFEQFFPNTNAHIIGVVVILLATLIGLVSIKSSALVTGGLLLVQIAAVIVMSAVGFIHHHQAASLLLHPQVFSNGVGGPVATGVIMGGVALAITVYNGYNFPIMLSEEIENPRKVVPRAVMFSLIGAAAMGIIPIASMIIGTPSLQHLVTEANPLSYVLRANAGTAVDDMVTISVIVALFNGSIVAMVGLGRVVFSSGRDRAWPDPINGWMAYVNPRFKTPMIATLFIGVVGMIITAFTNIAVVVNFAALLLVILYAMVALSAIVSRIKQKDIERPYRMPLWPLPPLVALFGCVIVITQQAVSDAVTVVVILGLGLVYYLAFLRPRSATHWVMLKPVDGEEKKEPAPASQ